MHKFRGRLVILAAFWLAAAAIAVSAGSCGRSEAAGKGGGSGARLRIVATTAMVADLVRNIAGDRAEVTGLMGEGVDPHLYKPTRSDMAALLGADMIFANGLLLEGKMTEALERVGSSGKPVLAVAEELGPDRLLSPEGFEGHPDPHVWMDPTAWMEAARAVHEALAEADPDGRDAYDANLASYLAQLESLDSYARRVLESVPERSRVLVTAHDAFNYFGRRYGYEVVGIQGISTESEAGVSDIERLVDLLVERRIGAVFVESTVSERNIRALITGAERRGQSVRIGGSLYSDAMGPPGTYEGTYIGMIDRNVTTIALALGGDAPESGMSGRLAAAPGRGGAGGR